MVAGSQIPKMEEGLQPAGGKMMVLVDSVELSCGRVMPAGTRVSVLQVGGDGSLRVSWEGEEDGISLRLDFNVPEWKVRDAGLIPTKKERKPRRR
jgi:hypothetical protein